MKGSFAYERWQSDDVLYEFLIIILKLSNQDWTFLASICKGKKKFLFKYIVNIAIIDIAQNSLDQNDKKGKIGKKGSWLGSW